MTTVKLERWRTRVAAARKQGMSLACYAREHGISRFTLYAAQRQLRRDGGATSTRPTRPSSAAPFVAVRVARPSPVVMRARLPNGVELEFSHLDAAGYAPLVGMLATLPCSS